MKFYGNSDVGIRRSENQDCFGIFDILPGVTVCVICDGMGGNAGGAIASRLAVDAFEDMLRETLIPDNPGDEPVLDEKSVRRALTESVCAANSTLIKKPRESGGKLDGMGTTLVALLVTEKGAWSVNVGDSRLYRVYGDRLERLTKDHSVVQQMLDNGEITPSQAVRSPVRNIITRAVGASQVIDPDVCSVDTYSPDGSPVKFMLCSDGLYGYTDEPDLVRTVNTASSLEEGTTGLIALANDAGGQDNITVILAEIP